MYMHLHLCMSGRGRYYGIEGGGRGEGADGVHTRNVAMTPPMTNASARHLRLVPEFAASPLIAREARIFEAECACTRRIEAGRAALHESLDRGEQFAIHAMLLAYTLPVPAPAS